MSRPQVRLGAGDDDASGLACMVASLLEDNVRDFRSRAAAARYTRGDVVLRTSDSDTAITLSFRPGQVVVEEGERAGAAVVEGEWIHMAGLCSGQRSVLAALAAGELRLRRGHGLRAAAGAGLALSVPPSFYGSESRWWRRHRGGLALALLAVAAIVTSIRRSGRIPSSGLASGGITALSVRRSGAGRSPDPEGNEAVA